MTEKLTIGERVAWYRRRRGMSQEVLAGLVGRTADWLQKAENNRIELDRLSVIRSLAQVLDVSIGDLIGEPLLLDWTADSRTRTVPALRAALMDYSQLAAMLADDSSGGEPPALDQLTQRVDAIFDAYQQSRFGYVTAQASGLLRDAVAATRTMDGDAATRAHELLAFSYQAAASVLTKLGEADLAWIAAERGLAVAQNTGSPVVLGSLFRSVAHTLLATGRYRPAIELVNRAAGVLGGDLGRADGPMLSMYGTLFLTVEMPTTCGPRSAPPTWLFTGSTPRWNWATYRSPSTLAQPWTPPACPQNVASATPSNSPAPTVPATVATTALPSC